MFLVATLSSKENELEECKKSIEMQTVPAEQVIYEGYDNVTAHHKVYALFNEAAEKFEYFCKLDADMRFNDKSVLNDVAIYFKNNLTIDHIILPVNDYFTGQHLLGIHFFRAGVKWKLSRDEMFVDPHPDKCGGRKVLYKWRNRVDHCFNPDDEQAFLFGVHRASKMIEAKKKSNFSQFSSQLMVLINLKKEFQKVHKKMHLLAMQGVISVAEGRITHKNYSNKIQFELNDLLTNDFFSIDKFNDIIKTEIASLSIKDKIKFAFRQCIHFIKLVMYGYI